MRPLRAPTLPACPLRGSASQGTAQRRASLPCQRATRSRRPRARARRPRPGGPGGARGRCKVNNSISRHLTTQPHSHSLSSGSGLRGSGAGRARLGRGRGAEGKGSGWPTRADVKVAGYVWRILDVGSGPGSARLGLIERQGGRALARRPDGRRAHFRKPCGFAVRGAALLAILFASILASGRQGVRTREPVRGRAAPFKPQGRRWRPWRDPLRSGATPRPRRKGARRWAVPCHGAWQGTARQRVALRRAQALSSARLAPGLREGLTPPSPQLPAGVTLRPQCSGARPSTSFLFSSTQICAEGEATSSVARASTASRLLTILPPRST